MSVGISTFLRLRIAPRLLGIRQNLELRWASGGIQGIQEKNFSSMVEDVMAKAGKDQDFDEMLSKVGPDATATFDNSQSNPTEYASSEATNAATSVNGRDVEEEDDDAAALEEDDELDEEEDVEDEAGV
jgi:hypothetical protein